MPDSTFEFKIVGDENAKAFGEMLQQWKTISEDNNRLLRESIELQRKYTNEINNTNRARRSAPRQPSASEQPPPRYTQDWETVYGPPVRGARGRYEKGEPQYSRAPREAATYPRSPTQQAEFERQQRTRWAQQEQQARSTRFDPFRKMDWSTPKQRTTTDQFKAEDAGPGKPEWTKPKVKLIFDNFHKDTLTWAKALPELSKIALQLYSLTKVVTGGGKAGSLSAIERLIFGEYALKGIGKGGGLFGALTNLIGMGRSTLTKTAAGQAAAEGLTATEVAEVAAPAAAMLLKKGLVVGAEAAAAAVAGAEIYYTTAQSAAMRGRRAAGYGVSTGVVSAADAYSARYNLDPDAMLSGQRSAKYDIESDSYFAYRLAGVDPNDPQATTRIAQWWSNYAKQPRFQGRGAGGLLPMARATGVSQMFGEAGAVTLAEETKPITGATLKEIQDRNLPKATKDIYEDQLSAMKMVSEQLKVTIESHMVDASKAFDAVIKLADEGVKDFDFVITGAEKLGKAFIELKDIIVDLIDTAKKLEPKKVSEEVGAAVGKMLGEGGKKLPDTTPTLGEGGETLPDIMSKDAAEKAFEEGGTGGAWKLPLSGALVRGGEGGGITLPPGAVAGGGIPVGGGSVRPAEPLHSLLAGTDIGGAPASIRMRSTGFIGGGGGGGSVGIGPSGLGPGARGRGGGAGFTGGSAISAGRISKGLATNQQEAYAAAKAEGLSDSAAKLLVANMSGESLRDPSNYHWDVHHMSQGIVQWDPQRAAAIKAQFGKEPKDMSVAEQTKASIWEMKTNKRFAPAWAALNDEKISNENRMYGVVKNYEAPADAQTATRQRLGYLGKLNLKDTGGATVSDGFKGGGGKSGGGGASGGWADTSTKVDSIDADFFRTRGGKRSEGLNPEFSSRLESAVGEAEKATGEKAQFTSLVRTREEQAKLYYNYIHHIGGQGLAAAPGTSLHEKGFASDLASGKTRDYVMAHLGKYGFEGVRGDPEHLQLSRALRDQETAKAIQDRTPKTQEAKDRTFAPSGGPHQRSPGPMSMNNMDLFQQNKSQNLTIYNKSGANVNAQTAMLGLSAGSFMS